MPSTDDPFGARRRRTSSATSRRWGICGRIVAGQSSHLSRSATSVGSLLPEGVVPLDEAGHRPALGQLSRGGVDGGGEGTEVLVEAHPPFLPRLAAAALRRRGHDLLDELVGVGQAREEDLVGAGGEGDVPWSSMPWKKRAKRSVSVPLGLLVVGRFVGAEEQADEGADSGARRRRAAPSPRPSASWVAVRFEAGVGVVVEVLEGGEPGGGGERVPRQGAGLVDAGRGGRPGSMTSARPP